MGAEMHLLTDAAGIALTARYVVGHVIDKTSLQMTSQPSPLHWRRVDTVKSLEATQLEKHKAAFSFASITHFGTNSR